MPASAPPHAPGHRRGANGCFESPPDKPAKPPGKPRTAKAPQAAAYAQYRGAALRLMKHLKEMMPPEDAKTGPRKKKAAVQPEPAQPEPAQLKPAQPDPAGSKPPETPKTTPEHERLLSKGQGVIDAFETLGLLVIRLIDKERESLEHAKPGATAHYPKIDEAELDRRFHEELDRIARRRESAGDAQPRESAGDAQPRG